LPSGAARPFLCADPFRRLSTVPRPRNVYEVVETTAVSVLKRVLLVLHCPTIEIREPDSEAPQRPASNDKCPLISTTYDWPELLRGAGEDGASFRRAPMRGTL
jgi:hypothetical protein